MKTLFFLGLLLVGVTTAGAQEPTLQQQFEKLQQEFDKEYREVVSSYSAASAEERPKILEKLRSLQSAYVEKFHELVSKDPAHPGAVDGLLFLMTRTQGEKSTSALQLLAKHHAMSPKIAAVVQNLTYSQAEGVDELLAKVAANNPAREAKAQATFVLASRLHRLGDRGDAAKSAEAERLYGKVKEEFADIKSGRGTMGDQATEQLEILAKLGVGKSAPEIQAVDLDGIEFKLSDYRGKVVLLDFWGNW